MFVATGVTNKRQRNYVADGTVSPVNRQNMMLRQDMIKQHEMDMTNEQQWVNDDIHSSTATSSPNTFYQPSSAALRNSPTVYVCCADLLQCPLLSSSLLNGE